MTGNTAARNPAINQSSTNNMTQKVESALILSLLGLLLAKTYEGKEAIGGIIWTVFALIYFCNYLYRAFRE